jgi:hypothetical protein
LSKRLAIFVLLAACSAAFSQQPQAAYSFDLKVHGFLVNRGIANNTTLGFITENQIGVNLYQNDRRAWLSKLLIFDIANQKTLTNHDDFSCPIIFAHGNLLCFQPGQVDIYDQRLSLLEHYQPTFGPNFDSTLDSAASHDMVHVSPDQLWISILVGGASEILSTRDLSRCSEYREGLLPWAMIIGLSRRLLAALLQNKQR